MKLNLLCLMSSIVKLWTGLGLGSVKYWYNYNMRRVMRKYDLCICKNKVQINCVVTAQLIRAFVFATKVVNFSTSLIRHFKPLATILGCTARFVSDLVGNPEDRLCHDVAQIALSVRVHKIEMSCLVLMQ